MQSNHDGDVETDDVVDADNGFEVNEDEPASGDKRKTDGSRAQQLKPHQVKLVLDKWKNMKEEAAEEGKEPTKASLLKWAHVESNVLSFSGLSCKGC